MEDEILLVEDDSETVSLVERALADAGLPVRCVSTVDDARSYLARRAVACVVLGVRVVAHDGAAAVDRLEPGVDGAPMVVLVADGALQCAVDAVKCGAAAVVAFRGAVDVPAVVAAVRDAVRDRAATRRARFVRPVFVARESELAFLADALARACAGEGRVVLVAGEAGIGKTRLAMEVASVARRRGAAVAWGHAEDEAGGAPPYWPWTQILRACGDDAAEALAALRDAGAAGPQTETPAARLRLVDGVAACLRGAAQRRPLLCVLDDVDAAGAETVELLRALASRIADAAILVVATHRDAVQGPERRTALSRIAGHPATAVVTLGGFEEGEIARFVIEATGVRPAKAVVRAVRRATDGNPLFVADVIGGLAAEGRLATEPPDGELPLDVPESRRAVVAHDVARLSVAGRRVLEAAAVVGTEIGVELLARVAERDPAATRAAALEAVAARLLIEGERVVRFANAIVRTVVYDAIERRTRARLHARVADALEAGSERDARPLAAIAHHRVEAAVSAADFARALGAVVAAASRAAEAMAHEEAARGYETALRVAEQGGIATPGVRTELMVELAEARWRAGHTDAARDAGRRALAVARATGDPGRVAAAALAFAGRLPGFGAIVCDEEVVAELEQALALLPATATALRATIMARLAEELTYLPRPTADRTLAPKAIALARSLDDPGVLAGVLRTTQWSVWTPDDVDQRRQLAEEVIALARRTRDPVLGLDGELMRLWTAFEHAEIDVARRQLVVATRLATRLRLPYYAWITTLARSCLSIATGRLDDAERIADEALRAGDTTPNSTVPLFVGALRGHVHWHRGRFEELAAWLRDVVGTFPMLASAVDCSLVITYAEAGQRELAQAELRRYAAEDFAGVPRNAMWLMNMTSLADGCVAVGDVDAARRLYVQLAPFARCNVVLVPVWVAAPVCHYMARLAILLGDGAAARRHFEDALVLEARTGTRQWGARTQLAYAEMLRGSSRAEDRERAEELVASARAIAAELDLAPVLAIVERMGVAASPVRRRCGFRRRGGEWELEFAGRTARVGHRVGLDYLRRLLERPGQPISALDLAGGGGPVLVEAAGDPTLDGRAVREIRRAMCALEAEVEAAADRGVEPADDVVRDLEQCRRQLANASSALRSTAEKARPAVKKAIDRAIGAIAEAHEALGYHLRRHVETGRTCVYVPDLAAPVVFDL